MTARQISTSTFIALITLTFSLKAQTSLEEYNYLTKGYKVQIESGLDMKQGYELKDIDSKSTKDRTASLKVLYRVKGASKEISGYLVIYNKNGNAQEYICIPHPASSDDIMTKYWNQLYDGTADFSARLQLIMYMLTKQLVW